MAFSASTASPWRFETEYDMFLKLQNPFAMLKFSGMAQFGAAPGKAHPLTSVLFDVDYVYQSDARLRHSGYATGARHSCISSPC